ASPHFNRLAFLDLGNNPLTDAAFDCFLDTQNLRSLRRLIVPLGISPRRQGVLENRFHRNAARN
ncbi:MAG TPA: hypothetical protein VGL71_07655, partial [Urbifossiella sp.]